MTSKSYFSSPAHYRVQKTPRQTIRFEGVGLHCGAKVRTWIHPAQENTGLVFRARGGSAFPLQAHFTNVVGTELATTLGHPVWETPRISTVEHIMAALYAMGITNAVIEADGPEIPILDGSAGPFVDAILDIGIEVQPYSTPILKVLRPIKVYEGGAVCELLPRDLLRLTVTIDFPHPAIGSQAFAIELTPQAFKDKLAAARTFGFLSSLNYLRSQNLAQGACLDNVLAFSEDGILNPTGVRFADECVRHKLLDAIGDLALCGTWIEGELVSFRGGHSIHLTLLKALEEHPSHWTLIPAEPLTQYISAPVALGLRA